MKCPKVRTINCRRQPLKALSFFYNPKFLNCIGALSFYDSKRSIGDGFLVNFIEVNFEARNETLDKFDVSVPNKIEMWSEKRRFFARTPLFSREREVEI